ncbi:MAG: NADH-quinone oxidoreductase subunit M [Hyphomicrobiales bacterium]|nr:NADH-quinone oxidoreductase subunit M [Hyphomicrobiales bacterium]
MTSAPWLSLTIWIPIAFGVAVLAFNDRHAATVRRIALIGAVLGLAVSLPLYTGFNTQTSAMQFVELAPWIPRFSINYNLGVDGISVLFILLNSFITVLVVIAGWASITKRVAQYMAAFLIMSGLLNGVFAALDAMLFYVFFEATLIPMFIIIGVWGGPNRVYAALKFFLYTLLGSLLMLVSFLYLYDKSGGSFSIQDWWRLPLPLGVQILLFFGFLLGFAVKVPMWPVHTWLPDAHVEAPTGGSVILAAIMLKMGGYGFLRFSLPMFPVASHLLGPLVFWMSAIAIVYTSLVALVQEDMKKLIAYSSVAHMGFVTMGLFSLDAQGVQGAVFQMVSHGLVSGALFLCVGVVYDRMHTREISAYGGLARRMPLYAFALMLFTMANVGLPGTSGFVGEFLTLIGAFAASTWVALGATTGVILSAAYALWLYRRVAFGALDKPSLAAIADLEPREVLVLAPLALLVVYYGVHPQPILDASQASVDALLRGVGAALASAAKAAAYAQL